MIPSVIVTVILVSTLVAADYDCLCSYAVEKPVYPTPDKTSEPTGYLYEFDCKGTVQVPGLKPPYRAVAFEHKLSYVVFDQSTESQICPGNLPPSDLIYTTTTPRHTSHVQSSRPSPRATKTTTPATTPPTTVLTTTPMPTTVTTTPRPTTVTITIPATTTVTTTPKPTTITTTTVTTTTPKPTTTTTTTPKPTTTTTTTPKPTTTTTTTPKPTTTTTTTPKSTTTTTTTPKPTTVTTTIRPTINYQNVYITGSPLAYIGIGYNLLTGNPGGLDKNNGGGDPGLLVNRRIFQLTPKANGSALEATEALVTSTPHCSSSGGQYLIHDGKTYQKELNAYALLVNAGDVSTTLMEHAFTRNTDFLEVRSETETGHRAVYTDSISTCQLGMAQYREKMAGSSHFPVTREFANDVCHLPLTYTDSAYFSFLEKWGTSIVMQVKTGTLSVKRYKTTGQQVLNHLVTKGTPGMSMVSPTGYLSSYPTSVTINSTQLSRNHMAPFGKLIDNRQLGTQSLPVPVHVTLEPITAALDIKYWTQILSHTLYSDICSNFDGAGLNRVYTNLKTAIQRYTTAKTTGDKPLKDVPITVPMTWPYGTYGLMQANSGCPGSRVSWHSGWRKFDTEDSDSHNWFSPNIRNYLKGTYTSEDITTYFCMKTQASTDAVYSSSWPAGSYCILEKGNCPAGMTYGKMHWDEEDLFTNNGARGTLPDGSYGDNTNIQFCCRGDGSTSNPILLPRDRNFILLRYKAACQSVYGMRVKEVIVRWDDEDILNSDRNYGTHPYDDGGSDDHILHFCYYTPTATGHGPAIIG